MVRIIIKWETRSPFLQVLSGILTAEDVDSSYKDDPILLFKCKVKVEQGSTGYSAISPEEGIPSKLFEKLRPAIDVMVHSYYRGTQLDEIDFLWIQKEEEETPLGQLVVKLVVNSEKDLEEHSIEEKQTLAPLGAFCTK